MVDVQRQSISAQFQKTIVLTVALVLCGFCTAALCFDALFLDKRMNALLYNAGKLAQVSLPHLIWNLDDTGIADVLDVIFMEKSIAALSLRGPQGLLGERYRPWARQKAVGEFDNLFFYLAQTFPVQYRNKDIATITIVFSRRDMFRQLAADFLILLCFGLLLGVAITLRAVRMTESLIFSPLKKLESAAAAIANGRLETVVEKLRDDEVGRLAVSFDHMRRSVRALVAQLQEVNLHLEEHNRLLEHRVAERTCELQENNKKLEETLLRVNEANTKIFESLQYAKKIQFSLFPDEEQIKQYLPNYFIVWEPRDIVSGDFFFIHPFEEGLFIALIDCTGHGVPGALMTMVAISSLRTVLLDEQCFMDPAHVLKRMNFLVRSFLKQDTNEGHSDDGLDAAVCFLDRRNKYLLFAGARMPLFYTCDLHVRQVKGECQSLGYRNSDISYTFSNHRIPFETGAVFYLTSDGFFDQLGGEKRLPFGYKRFQRLVDHYAGQSMERQRDEFMKAFFHHCGSEDIQDDVTVVAFSP